MIRNEVMNDKSQRTRQNRAVNNNISDAFIERSRNVTYPV